ncbi:hydrogen gas-evolving membrane-bound hydrogenase subunit E [Sporohalobacter salinus]|uniref:hydrogen gas-evolving membrane-bound hydrogenase subunit E n=1 Tax=Sporohalobacter salinus TaxID=1494606 RepID=UPI00195FD0E0|nr:hydrogen gas-evolving membrane-bound hydrogenase subunit E [Sporohalobacter salinus]MBM7625057.1 multisubunit Na+/H+ antiporter MnhB subunit [Sporohalobacter salinus]
MKKLTSLIFILILGFVVAIVVSDMPTFGIEDVPVNNQLSQHYINKSVEETGSFNIVGAILVDYRAYDTLVETIVLFTASTVVASIFINPREN